MAWNEFVKDTTIASADIRANFDFAAAGHILPRQGSSMSATTSSLDLGSQTKRYDTIYCNNLDITGEIKNGLNLISEVTLDDTASAVDFTNINGDRDEVYMLTIYTVNNTISNFRGVVFNNDSAANYGYQALYAIAGAPAANRAGGTNQLLLAFTGGQTTTAIITYNEMFIYSKTGNERSVINKVVNNFGGTHVEAINQFGQVWNNTSDTITSIKVFTGSGWLTGTNIQLWALTQTLTARTVDPTTT